MSVSEEEILEVIVDFCNALEAAAVNVKHRISEISGVKTHVQEEVFNCLTWDRSTGAKIGSFEVAFKAKNLPEKFLRALNVLRRANATIRNRYYGSGFTFTYWLYAEDRIYRQRLKKNNLSS